MADWTNLPNTAVGVGGLPSGTTVTALRDNPVAIAEGAAGAPPVIGNARSHNLLATATITTSVSSLAITDLPEYIEYAIVTNTLFNISSSDAVFGLQISDNNGSSYSQVIRNSGLTNNVRVDTRVFVGPLGSFALGILSVSGVGLANEARTGASSLGGTINAMRLNVSTGNITAGSFSIYGVTKGLVT
jgi:hypothetical protein